MRGGQSRSYAIHAEAGQYFHVVVEQKGIDLTLTLLDPDNKQVAQSNMPGREPISTVAESSGEFHLQVTSLANNALPGRYEVQLMEMRPPMDADRNRISAERAYLDAQQLNDQKNFEAAAHKWEESAGLWHSLNDGYEEAVSLHRLGVLYSQLRDLQKALDYYSRAVPLRRAVEDHVGEAATLNNIGNVYRNLADQQKSADFYNQALTVERVVRDSAGEVRTLNNLGNLYSSFGENQKAMESYNQVLPLERALRDRASEASTRINMGGVFSDTADQEKALVNYNKALSPVRVLGDRKGEAQALTDIALAYTDIGEQEKSLNYYNQALSIERSAGDRAGEAGTLHNIANVYADIGEKQKALDFYDQALAFMHESGDRRNEARTLMDIGILFHSLGEMQKSLDYYNQALPLERAVGDRAFEGVTLLNIANVYGDIGEKQKALDYFNQSLPIMHAVGDRRGEARVISDIGNTYSGLGEKQKALDYFNQALPTLRAVQDRPAEARTLINIGQVYADLGQKQKGLVYFNQALPIERAVQDRATEAITLGAIGEVYSSLGEKQRALDYYNQALPIEREIGDRRSEAGTLTDMGAAYSDLGDKPKALDSYNQSLPLSRAVQDPMEEGFTLAILMEYWKGLQNPSLAVLFGKQAIDRFQQLRRNIGGLDRGTQQSFLKSKEDYYRELAELLVTQGRVSEALQILDLLKAEEYSDFTQRRGNAASDTGPVALTPMEEKSNQDYEQITSNITAIGSEWTQLHAKSSRSPDEEKRYSELSNNLTAATQRLQTFMKGLYESFGKGDQANAKVENVREETAGLQNLVAELGGGTTAVYTLVTDQKLAEMVITPGVQVAREVTISKTELRAKVFAFTHSLAEHDSEDNIRAKAQDLYNILIAPIEKDLQGAQTRTLVWSLDDVLRYVPFAALYDGKQYLVERFQNVVITTASAGNLKDQPQVSSWRGAAMGVSKDYDGLGQLKAVPGELDAVVHSDAAAGSHGPVPGDILLDDLFTETHMESELERHPPLVHIASH